MTVTRPHRPRTLDCVVLQRTSQMTVDDLFQDDSELACSHECLGVADYVCVVATCPLFEKLVVGMIKTAE